MMDTLVLGVDQLPLCQLVSDRAFLYLGCVRFSFTETFLALIRLKLYGVLFFEEVRKEKGHGFVGSEEHNVNIAKRRVVGIGFGI
jgi:hypothetical protein